MSEKTPVVNYKQLGLSGLKRQGPYIYEEFLPNLRWPQAGDIYQEMADNDPVIGAILYLAEMLIRGTSYSVQAASDSEADIEAAKFVESCMHDMDMSWANTISEILSMLTYGFSFHEIVYKVRRGPLERSDKYRSKYSDGRIGWRRIPIRAQSTLHQWEFQKNGDVTAFVQVAYPNFEEVRIPISRGLLFRTRISRDNPEGKSLLRNAYRPWFFKKHFEEIEGIGIERDLAGFPILQAPENINLWDAGNPEMVKLKAMAEKLVASVRRDSEEGILLPHGWDFKLLASGSSRQINISDTIDRYDRRIAITMLSDIILIGDKSGSFALADTKQSILASALQSQLQNIADVFNNKAIPDLFRYNMFPDITELPKIVPGHIQTPSLKELALVMRSMGLEIAKDMPLQNYLRRILGLPELDKKSFKEIYESQGSETTEVTPEEGSRQVGDDTVDNDFKQYDQDYTGQRGE